MASSGMCRTEYTPINTSADVVSRTMNLFWSENSMMRLSMVSVEWDECRRNDSAHEPYPPRASDHFFSSGFTWMEIGTE